MYRCSQTLCFYKQPLISNTRLKLAKNQENSKQHHDAELLLLENYSLSLYIYMGHIFKNKQNNKCICIHEIIRLFIRTMKMKMKKDHIDTT